MIEEDGLNSKQATEIEQDASSATEKSTLALILAILFTVVAVGFVLYEPGVRILQLFTQAVSIK